MIGFIKLHTGADEVVFINPVHIVKIEEIDFHQGGHHPPLTRTLISTVDDTCIGVIEKPYEVLDRIYREGRECCLKSN